MNLPDSCDRSSTVDYLLRVADERLILGHRLSEWCGHAPILEEELALANIALDLLGQAEPILDLAGSLEGQGRSADDLVFFREAIDFRNALLVELPIGDFGFTIVRQFLFDAYSRLYFDRLRQSRLEGLGAIAEKALKEILYHRRHSRQWMLRLGIGTDESRRRVNDALQELWRFTGELFEVDQLEAQLVEAGVAVDRAALQAAWSSEVKEVLRELNLAPPDDGHQVGGGRRGRHTEHLGLLLAEMQILARSHPGAQW